MPVKLDKSSSAGSAAWRSPAESLESALSAIGAWRFGAQDRLAGASDRSPRLRTGLLLMLAIGLLPALAGTALYLRQLREVALRDAFNQADLIAGSTAESLRWLMQDAQAMLAAVAARPKVKALDAGDCDAVFRDFHGISPTFKALALRRLDGDSVCSELPRPPSRQSVAEAEWFQAAVQQPGFYATAVHQGAVQQTWTSRLTLPVIGASGQAEGLLVTPLNLPQLQQRLFARLPAGALAAVVDGSNRVVVRSQQQDDRVGKPAAEGVIRVLETLRRGQETPTGGPATAMRFSETGINGARQLFVVRLVPMTDWAVVAALPEDGTLRDYRNSRDHALSAVAATLLLVAWAAWRVSRGILVPIRDLASAARAVAAGDTTRRAAESGPREVAKVAQEFNRMLVATAEAGEKLQASESHYRTLIQNLPVAVVAHRPDSSIEVFNDRACTLLRMTSDQMTGKTALDRAWHFVDVAGQRLMPADYPVSRVLRSGQPMPATVLGIVAEPLVPSLRDAPPASAGASPVVHTWVMVTAYPQFAQGGEMTRAIVVFVDVTAQRQTEDLRVAKEAAEAASKAKSVFLSRVSHELRTPLNAINGFSELMLMDEQVPDDSKIKLRLVLNAGQHLLSLIDQILDLTRLESGPVRTALEPVPLWPLLHDCVAICGPLALARGVTMAVQPDGVDGPQKVLGDATALRQVLINLLSNAIKYNRPGGRVSVTVERQAGPAADLARDTVVTVHDTGPGLKPGQIETLFQPFNRLGAEFSGIEGHGLGLSISRLLAQSMSGEITVDSQEGQGSSFSVHLRSDRSA